MDSKKLLPLKMKILSIEEIHEVQGGISWGTIVFALVTGFVTGGPVGLGIAASGLVGAEGIDNLVDLVNDKKS